MSRYGKFIRDFFAILILTLVLLEGLLQVGSHIMSRPEVRTAVYPAGNIRILCLGDSHTYGLFLNHEQAWPAVLERELHAQGFPSVEVINLAYPSTNSYRVRFSIERILEDTRPDYVILLLGANDYWTTPLDLPGAHESSVVRFTRTHIKLYKLVSFFMRTHEAGTSYYLEDKLRHVHEEPEEQALHDVRDALHFYGVKTVTQDDALYAVWQENRVSVHDVVEALRLRSAGKKVLIDGYETTDSGVFNLAEFEKFLEEKLHMARSRIMSVGGLVGYDGNQYLLGASLKEDAGQADGKKMSSDLADNFAYIVKKIRESRAQPVLMTYHFQVKYVYANDVIRKFSMEHDIPLIDLHRAMKSVCQPLHCPQYLFTDLHPNIAGQEFIAAQVQSFMESRYFHGEAGPATAIDEAPE